MKIVQFILFIVAFACCAAVTTAALHAEPVFYQPYGWALGTQMPDQPRGSEKVVSAFGGQIQYLRAVVQQNGELYLMQRARFPIPLPADKRDEIYDAGKVSMLRGDAQTLRKEEKITVCGYEGRRYLVVSADKQHETDYRAVVIGDEVYEFIYQRPANNPPSDAANAFFSGIISKKE